MPGRGCRSACRPWPTRWGRALPCWHRCCGAWRGTFLPPNDCTVTTRPCRCSPRERRLPVVCGRMYGMTGRLVGRTRRRRCSTIRAIAAASTRPGIWLVMPGSSRPDAYGGYNKLYEADRRPGPIVEATCWAHARRPFFVLADLAANARRKAQGKPASVISPLALEAVRRIDAIFAIEREINGHSAAERLA